MFVNGRMANKSQYMSVLEYYAVMEREEELIHATAWMNLENYYALSVGSQTYMV